MPVFFRKVIFLFVLFFLFAGETTSQVLATQSANTPVFSPNVQISSAPQAIYPYRQSVFPGEDQFYTVTFRGDAEAIVNMKVLFANTFPTPLATIELRNPSPSLQNITAYQAIQNYPCPTVLPNIPLSQTKQSTLDTLKIPAITPCPLNTSPLYYPYTNLSFEKAIISQTDTSIIIHLPSAIAPNSTGSYLLEYAAQGYAHKNLFGAYDFSFDTLSVNDQINTVQVGINTDSNFILRDQKGQVNYAPLTKPMGFMPEIGSSLVASDFTTLYNQIGQGDLIKTTTNLQPKETYHVQGGYADSIVKLYAREIFRGISMLAFFFLFIIFGLKYAFKKYLQRNDDHHPRFFYALKLTGQTIPVFESICASILAALFILFYLLLMFLARNYSSSLFSVYYYQFPFTLIIFFFLISFSVLAFLLVIPSLFVGLKRGLIWGVSTLALTILWLIITLVFFFTLLLIFTQTRTISQPVPTPLLEQSKPQTNPY